MTTVLVTTVCNGNIESVTELGFSNFDSAMEFAHRITGAGYVVCVKRGKKIKFVG